MGVLGSGVGGFGLWGLWGLGFKLEFGVCGFQVGRLKRCDSALRSTQGCGFLGCIGARDVGYRIIEPVARLGLDHVCSLSRAIHSNL